MKVGILTGGGDAPGLNAAIRAVVRAAISHKHTVVAIERGWAGLVNDEMHPLDSREVSGMLPRGGTMLGTSRTNPFADDESLKSLLKNFKKARLGAVVAIGGEDTLGVANRLFKEHALPVVGIPKTIDNDLAVTDYTIGFDTAVTIATEAIDRLHTTAESHDRVMVVEVMGRHVGWIATSAGMAGGADAILIPEYPFDIDDVCMILKRRRRSGKRFSIVVVSEGAKPLNLGGEVKLSQDVDAFGHVRLGGIGTYLGAEIEKRTGIETRVTMLGHIQRGGTPTAFDRILATRFGIAAVDLIQQKKFGRAPVMQGNTVKTVPLSRLVATLKLIDEGFYKDAQLFFG